MLRIDAITRSHDVGATSTEVASGTTNVQGVAAAAGLRLLGIAVREDAGVPLVATVLLHHGTTTSDPVLLPCELLANESIVRWFGPDGVNVPNGVFVNRASGTTHLVVFTKVVL